MDMLRSIGKQSVRGLASLDNCLVYQKYVLVTCSTVVIRRTLLISCGGADFSSAMALKLLQSFQCVLYSAKIGNCLAAIVRRRTITIINGSRLSEVSFLSTPAE